MSTPRRPNLGSDAVQRNRAQLLTLGERLREARRRRRLTQAALGKRVGLAQSSISQMERGFGGGLSIDTWQRTFVGLGIGLTVDAGRDPIEEPRDAGHLQLQELVIRLGRRAGYVGLFELASKPNDPSRSTDVGLRDDRRRRLVLVECWNTIGDIGASVRSTARKTGEAEGLAVALGGGNPHRVATCWVVRATRRNQQLLARYPEVFASRFTGSSVAWVRALMGGAEPPVEPGLVWADVRATRIFAWRRPRDSGGAAVLGPSRS